jgi:hypothetical protein
VKRRKKKRGRKKKEKRRKGRRRKKLSPRELDLGSATGPRPDDSKKRACWTYFIDSTK